MMRPSRLTDPQVIRALNYNESLREPDRDEESDADAFLSVIATEEDDEVWDYMTELLEAGEIDFDDFRHQMLSAGYCEDQIDLVKPETAS